MYLSVVKIKRLKSLLQTLKIFFFNHYNSTDLNNFVWYKKNASLDKQQPVLLVVDNAWFTTSEHALHNYVTRFRWLITCYDDIEKNQLTFMNSV